MGRKRKTKDWEGEKQKLTDFIYRNDLEKNIVQYSEYHFRIFGNKKAVVDVWPGSNKFYIPGRVGSQQYENVEELKEYLKL